MDERSCIVVMMMGDNRVKSQLLRLQLKVDLEQMPTLVNLLNTHFTGISVDEMNQELMNVAEQVPPQLFLLLSQTIAYAVDALEEAARGRSSRQAPASCSSSRSFGTRIRPMSS